MSGNLQTITSKFKTSNETLHTKLQFIQGMARDGNIEKAEYELSQLLSNDSGKADAVTTKQSAAELYNLLGILYITQNKKEAAKKCFENTLKLNPEHSKALSNLGIILFEKGEIDKAVNCHELSVKNDPYNVGSYYNYAVAFRELGKINEAIENFRTAIKLNKNYADAHFNLALLLLLTGKYEEGWKEYTWGFLSKNLFDRKLPGKKWLGEKLSGKTIYVFSDQGFGDAIQFVRYLPFIKTLGGKIIFECQPELYELFENQNFGDKIVKRQKSLIPLDKYDYFIGLSELPEVLKTNPENIPNDIPYVKINSNIGANISSPEGISNNLKVGLCWSGNPNPPINKKRHIKLDILYPLLNIDGIEFYSLQKGDAEKELSALPSKFHINNLISESKNFYDTALIINELDLIITVDTAVAHLAGAMGKPVWLMVPFVPDWRWGINVEYSSWYPTVRIIRQKQMNDWKSVISEIFNLLSDKKIKSLYLKNLVASIKNIKPVGIQRFINFLTKIENETYPETPSKIHSDISNTMIDFLVDNISLSPNTKILDVGCGQGVALTKFKEKGFNAIGITLNDTDVKICREKGFEVYKMYQSFLNFPDDSFGLLWARHILEHSIFPYYTLNEYKRVLKKSGILYIEIPASNSDCKHERNINHYSILNRIMWESLFERHNFQIIYKKIFALENQYGKDKYWVFILKEN